MKKYIINGYPVKAVYDNSLTKNPLQAALPEILSQPEFMNAIGSFPHLPYTLPRMASNERRQYITMLSSLFIPLDYMYSIYDALLRAIATTYQTKTIQESIRNTNLLFCRNGEKINYVTQADTGSILGVSGIGKTSVVCRCLDTIPQVIEHTEYEGKQFFCKQVLYLRVECPSDCSVKTLAFNIIVALDKAIGSNYVNQSMSLRGTAASTLATRIKILCLTFHVGLLVIDEIQNAVITAQRKHQIKPLLRFLLELTNDIGMAIYFVGTPLAEELFTAQEYLKRRTRGVRLLPLKPGGTYRMFLEKLWQYQFTPKHIPLTDQLANKLYDYSAGIPAYIITIFREAQVQALLSGSSSINERIIQRTIDTLAIKVPKVFQGGTSISDFIFTADEDLPEITPEPVRQIEATARVSEDETGLSPVPAPKPDQEPAARSYPRKRGRRPKDSAQIKAESQPEPAIKPDENPAEAVKDYIRKSDYKPEGSIRIKAESQLESAVDPEGKIKEVPRDYANKRGRKKLKRDELDLITVYQSDQNILEFLWNHDLLEVFEPIC